MAVTPLREELSAAAQRIDRVLAEFLSVPNRRSLFRSAARRSGVDLQRMTESQTPLLIDSMEGGLRMFATDPRAADKLRELFQSAGDRPDGSHRPKRRSVGGLDEDGSSPTRPARASSDLRASRQVVIISKEEDIVKARSIARGMCTGLGMTRVSTTKLVTVVSELARNIFQYVGRGTVTLRATDDGSPSIEVFAQDEGPGIPHIDDVLSGTYRSRSGMGAGIRGAKALADEFDLQTGAKGTQVRFVMFL